MLKIVFSKIVFLFYLFFCVNFIYADVLPDESIYHLGISFVNQNGKVVDMKDLCGKIHIFSMIYTRCKTTCPIILENMKKLEKLIPSNILKQINFSLVSLDPLRDNVEVLKKFVEDKGIDRENWNLFFSSEKKTLELAVTLGIKYKKENDGNYVHSNLILLIDKNGVIKFHHPGLVSNFDDILYSLYKISE